METCERTGMNNVLQLLPTIAYGDLVVDANEHLAQVVAAVKERGGKGSITLKIEVEGRGNAQCEVTGAVSSVAPKGEKRMAVLFFGKGGLSKKDPNQPELPTLGESAPEGGSIHKHARMA